MAYSNIHFTFNPERPIDNEFALQLIASFGQCPKMDADLMVAVGGDGTVLYALQESLNARKAPVLGIKPPESNSLAYLGMAVKNTDEVKELLENVQLNSIKISPLNCVVKFTNGKAKTIYAFNDISVVRASRHACYIDVSVSGEIQRVKGDGLIVSTALGSTGINYSYQGPVLKKNSKKLVLNGMGVYEPSRKTLFNPHGFSASVLSEKSIFELTILYGEKKYGSTTGRPVRIDYDTGSVEEDVDGSVIREIRILADKKSGVPLLLGGKHSSVKYWLHKIIAVAVKLRKSWLVRREYSSNTVDKDNSKKKDIP